MGANGCGTVNGWYITQRCAHGHEASFEGTYEVNGHENKFDGVAETAPHAICLAALKVTP